MPRTLHALQMLALPALMLALPGSVALAQEDAPVNLAAEGRRSAEVARDATSKPIEVFDWIDVDEGDAVADIYAGAGYNTWVL
ncbi:MAG: hypothetical protein ABR559_02460, partial [Gemmatimonadota bacterium]